MRRLGRRTWFLLGLGAISVPLVAAAVAYGCTAAATLSANPGAAAAGSTVTITGKYFGTHDPQDINSNSPVQIRIGSVSGPILATGTPTGTDRAFSVQVRVPQMPAGDTFISATQLSATGTPVYGTPARQAFKVVAPAASGPQSTSRGGQQTQVGEQIATLSLASARRIARARVKAKNRRARRIRARCVRRSRTSAVCRVRYKVGSKSRSTRLVVKSQSSAATW